MSLALGAFFRIDYVHVVLKPDRGVRTFELAGSAYGALRRDDLIRHGGTPLLIQTQVPSFNSHAKGGPAQRLETIGVQSG